MAATALLMAAQMVAAQIPADTCTAFQSSVEFSLECPIDNPPSTCVDDGLGAQAVVSADVDGDGIPDLVIANNESDNVSVLYGNGDGTFVEPPVNVEAFFGPSAVAVADMNRDGKRDIVVAHDFDSNVAILLQGATRDSFTLGGDLGTGDGPEGLVVADFNGDGFPDAATANYSDDNSTVSVLLGAGDGTFMSRADYMTSTESFVGPFALAVADLNRDGFLDLAVANADDSPSSVGVLLGAGDGNFDLLSTFPVGRDLGGPVSIAIADFNIDNIPDVVTANEDDFTVSVLLGQGDGQLGTKTDIEVGISPEAVAVSDLNLDGRPDIAVANSLADSDGVTVLRGDGSGAFLAGDAGGCADSGNFAIGGFLPTGIAIGDFNRNGKHDIATANSDDPSMAVSVLLNSGNLLLGDSNADGSLTTADVDQVVPEIFDGDGSNVITVAGGTTQSGPGVDGNKDHVISAADILAVATIVVGG